MDEKFPIPIAANDNRREGSERMVEHIRALLEQYQDEEAVKQQKLAHYDLFLKTETDMDRVTKIMKDNALEAVMEALRTLHDINQKIRVMMDDLFAVNPVQFDALVPLLEAQGIFLYQPIDDDGVHFGYAKRRLEDFMSQYRAAEYAQKDATVDLITSAWSEKTEDDARHIRAILFKVYEQMNIKNEVKALLARVAKYNPPFAKLFREMVIDSGVMEIDSKTEIELDTSIADHYISYQRVIQILEAMRIKSVVDIDQEARLKNERDAHLIELAQALKELSLISKDKAIVWKDRMERELKLLFDLDE